MLVAEGILELEHPLAPIVVAVLILGFTIRNEGEASELIVELINHELVGFQRTKLTEVIIKILRINFRVAST